MRRLMVLYCESGARLPNAIGVHLPVLSAVTSITLKAESSRMGRSECNWLPRCDTDRSRSCRELHPPPGQEGAFPVAKVNAGFAPTLASNILGECRTGQTKNLTTSPRVIRSREA